jgi:hypothetical protein
MSAQHDDYSEQKAANERRAFNKERAEHTEQLLYTKDKTPTLIIVSENSTIQQEHILQLLNKID